MTPFIQSFGTGKTNLLGKKSEYTFPLERWAEGLPGEGCHSTCWDNGHCMYLNGGLGYTGICICQNLLNNAFRIYAFHAMQI